ncbi:MAG: hypothetical protein DCC69_10120 [Hyphomicrobiales bacterium]|nr:MAG: hypothetical protein DCC69_10120 [Hyphomicrobiales bacterium]
MEDAITETYSRILTRTVRNPKAEKNRGHLPIIIAAFDLPVFKYDKDHLADIAINDGLHVHGIWMMPRKTRLEGDLSGEFLNHQRRYAGPGRPISRIVSERIEKTPGRVTEYMLKTIGHGRMDLDGVIILPRSRRELSFTELTTSPL